MGASDSKLVFKQGIFKLSEPKVIPEDDPYWTSYWDLPESAEDVFSLFAPADIRRTRDNNFVNLETLIRAVCTRIFLLRNHPSFPDPEIAPEKHILNCIRVLTRVLPFIYECDRLEEWQDQFFWAPRKRRSRRGELVKAEVLFDEAKPGGESPVSTDPPENFEEAKPLAEELLDTLTDLLFFSGFTLPQVQSGKNRVTYSIWQSGVGCNMPVASTKEYESNRSEILRLLLAITGKSMYTPPNILPVKGVKAITYFATCPDKQVVLSVLCSLLNTTLKYNPANWRVPYDHVVYRDPKQILVTYCLQFLLVLLLYPVPDPENGQTPKNFYRHFFGRLHRPQDFQFLTDGMARVLKQPVQVHSSYLPGSQKSLKWAPEMIMLYWEALQCNKRFRSFVIDTDRAHDFVILILFYALENKNDPSKQGIVRMCVFVLQTMSVEPNFGRSLKKAFEGQESLPNSVRVPNFVGTYADYLVISIFNLITGSKGKLDTIYPALMAIINNIAPYIENLSLSASSKLLQLFNSISSPSFLLANETNHALLQSLLESMNAIIEHRYKENPKFIYAVIRSKHRFEALRTFTLESAQEEIGRLNQARKDHRDDLTSDFNVRNSRHGNSPETIRSLNGNNQRQSSPLSDVPEDSNAFAIGDDEDFDEDNEAHPPRSQASAQGSRTASLSSSIDDAVPLQLRGMSEKARGKMPVGQPSFSRQNSTTSINSYWTASHQPTGNFMPSAEWVETWLAELPLHTIMTVISEVSPRLPARDTQNSSAANSSLSVIHDTQIHGIEPSPIRVQLFEWSPLSLGWYESLLWGFIFAAEMVVSKGTVGVWNGTSIKLFRVQEAPAEGPTLLAPRGAVDAVGTSIVQRIGSLNLGSTQPQSEQGGANESTGTIRNPASREA
ncbi:hypothetical protein L228DRAFT_254011 [Xylona heveae TC161]|uniref:High-temperature-induced dauer-formation protein n=1 Tax=Xylona heveae (strain CBS 132557 / TC161) TaxID=1328760 RepID=A0A165ADE5_XYLHT|nr:hypothetical protein L228DRAFT_254011 [Xylona heveae TC161]KZF20294.1 hypothetical protein L228DRAFT_254011 [Xylona heveae TC161]